jgi:hypothetical protein
MWELLVLLALIGRWDLFFGVSVGKAKAGDCGPECGRTAAGDSA